MKTKILSLLMILSMGIFIASCGKNDKQDEPDGPNVPEVDNHFTVGEYKYSLKKMYIYENFDRSGCNILFVGDENVTVKTHMNTAPDCPWLAMDIPVEALDKIINDPKDLNGEEWKFFCMESRFKENVWPEDISSVSLKFMKPTPETFSISFAARVYGTPIELEWLGEYTQLYGYIVAFCDYGVRPAED